MPGPIQRNSGVNGRATTLKPWVNVNPFATASNALRLPLVVGNDANFAALAETTWGVARGMRDVAYVYTASGIGVGFILGGALYVGRQRHRGRTRPHHDRRERRWSASAAAAAASTPWPTPTRSPRTCGAATATGYRSPT